MTSFPGERLYSREAEQQMKAKTVLKLYEQGRTDFRGENFRGQSFRGKNLSEADLKNRKN